MAAAKMGLGGFVVVAGFGLVGAAVAGAAAAAASLLPGSGGGR